MLDKVRELHYGSKEATMADKDCANWKPKEGERPFLRECARCANWKAKEPKGPFDVRHNNFNGWYVYYAPIGTVAVRTETEGQAKGGATRLNSLWRKMGWE